MVADQGNSKKTLTLGDKCCEYRNDAKLERERPRQSKS